MKKKLLSRFTPILCAFLFLNACSKTSQLQEEFPEHVNLDSLLRRETGSPIPTVSAGQCLEGPKYKDSLIYIESAPGNDYIIRPINNPGEGKYYSWPQGLRIDSVNGSINVSQSETGLRYMIGFVRNGTNDTCFQNLVLAGASYVDSIYVLGKNQTLAPAYFDANLQTTSVCVIGPGEDDDTDNDGNDKCKFLASNRKVKVKSISGTIDLKTTLENKAFGDNPVNGTAIKVTINYGLKDKSNQAPQQLDVILVYYETKSEIPQALVNYIQQKRDDIVNQVLIGPRGNPRPPLIVITRS